MRHTRNVYELIVWYIKLGILEFTNAHHSDTHKSNIYIKIDNSSYPKKKKNDNFIYNINYN